MLLGSGDGRARRARVSSRTPRIAAVPPDGRERGREEEDSSMDGATSSAQQRIVRSIGASVIEGSAIYVWLWLYERGVPWWWAFAALAAGEVIETALLGYGMRKAASRRWGKLKRADEPHYAKVTRIISVAGTLEIGIWAVWLGSFEWLEGAARPYEIVGTGLVLLALMHVKHQVESAAIRDMPLREGFFSKRGVFASASEVVGAVACLALIQDGQFFLAGAALFAGLLIEHVALIASLHSEITARDIRGRRDRRWQPPRERAFRRFLFTNFAWFWKLVDRIEPLQRRLNRSAINYQISVVDPRPNPLSTMVPYTCWPSLTDRSYSGRHLPPASSLGSANTLSGLPSAQRIAALFKREGEMIECSKSTVLFGWFAQWFTDGFLRTSLERGPDRVRQTLRSVSNHEIDLSPLYGTKPEVTKALRAHHDGLLRSQLIRGEEYPVYLCEYGRPKAAFNDLPTPRGFGDLSMAQKDRLFAMGADVTNLGFVACNVLFLREHNRIARELSAANPGWKDEQIFQTARNVLIVLLIKIVVEEYIHHISVARFQPRLKPMSFRNEPWYRPNWMTIEFNLLYRWHSLAPSTFHLNGTALSVEDTLSDTRPLTAAGLGPLMAAASNQPAGRIGLFNTDKWFINRVELPTIRQARNADLCSYNDYRRLCRYPPARRWDEISSDERIQDRLKALYRSVDKVELYVGLFAEDTQPNGALPPLMNTMVAFDAFSQALTNPLLAPRIFDPATFSHAGWKLINETKRLSDIVNRNVPRGSEYFVSFTRRDFERV
jgi:prostaglandin-endoperoxide synthase 2